MSFSKFAFLNVTRNKRAYLGYFLSNVLTVMAFFTFMSLSAHPFVSTAHPLAAGAMTIASYFILFFSFFYVAYSMNAFLQLRKKEFGILMINGLSPKQLRKLIQQENFYIGVIASVVGILLGLALSVIIGFFAKVSFDIIIDFYLPWKTIIFTLGLFTLLFFFISTYVFYKISKNDLLLFLKQDRARTAPKASIALTILSIVLILTGYAIAIITPGALALLALLPVATLVTIGTYLFVSQCLVFWANRAKRNKKKFWHKTNMLFYSDLDYRLKDNARSFFFITIITTIIFCSLGTLFSLEEMFNDVANTPYDFNYSAITKTNERPNEWSDFENRIKQADTTFTPQEISALSFNANDEYFEILSESAYNTYATEKIDIPINQANQFLSKSYADQPGATSYFVGYSTTGLEDYNILISDVLVNADFPSFFSSYLVVDDITYQQLEKEVVDKHYNFVAIGNTLLSNKEQAALTAELIEPENIEVEGYLLNSAYTLAKINEFYSPVLFIGIFVGIVFFISAGSFLYFRLYGDLAEDREKLSNIARIGLTKKEARIVIIKQLALLFGIPMILAVCHGFVALDTMAGMFEQSIKSSAIIVMVAFVVIQFIYFLASQHVYLKQVLSFEKS